MLCANRSNKTKKTRRFYIRLPEAPIQKSAESPNSVWWLGGRVHFEYESQGWKIKWTIMEAWKCCVSYLAITLLSVTGSHSCRVETITSWDVFGITVTKYPYLYLKRYWSV
ncbi:hypothetical protein RvY_09984-2 [Ramazzottius varieornatus]|uniref:Uncharacterized protein n=1 Tax=Ramazzottius varieornatus TaxID=947166 RepID=A0A1D1VB92_RAMVA|nr:hypothetical protein RvY_09984-2 [Ramazzottius varieornatus]